MKRGALLSYGTTRLPHTSTEVQYVCCLLEASVCVAAGIKKPKAIRKWLSVVAVVGAGRVHRRKMEIIERGDEGKWDIKNN